MSRLEVERLNYVLIVSVTPYFLEKGSVWFEENFEKISKIRKTQSWWQDNILILEKNQIFNFSQFLRKLDELGYEKVYKVEGLGEFSQRGGIVDIFPINPVRVYRNKKKKQSKKNSNGVNLNYAIRLEFFGNKIEGIEKLEITVEDESIAKKILKKKLKSQKLFSDLKGLKTRDYLVHLDHGVGIYNQKTIIDERQYYQLEYASGDKLYVPVGLERKLSRYIGFVQPKISRLGSSLWQRIKKKVKEEAEKLARELLEIYAKREIAERPPYLPAHEIDSQLASTFQYVETPDQIQAIEDIKKDLEKERPMDKLVCGDVGFGKTEVALRAMVKVVNSGYQTTMICPTTILANQHFQNFKERLKNLPIKISLLSRLQTKKEQRKIITQLKEGKIDILIGTHRILSKDVEFKKLGLLVIDDEQRFGVKQKEKLKKLKTTLDILSLSATPIPRTLYLTLSSLKSISLMQTPPQGRLPVKTFISPWSEKIIKKAIESEIKRGGQIYFLHNRIETMRVMKKFLENLFIRMGSFGLPKPKRRRHAIRMPEIGIAHGRLREKELVRVMEDFQRKKIDILLATTIIENGLDLPNVNTLIVADATRLGLAEAYQLRGRVGRSHVQAFAYFFYPPKFSDEKFKRASGKKLTEKVYPPKFRETKFERAKMRLDALKEAEALGSGYKIALRDLEIRGAGNILGKEQSGNINSVGLNLYCQMLAESIEKLKREK